MSDLTDFFETALERHIFNDSVLGLPASFHYGLVTAVTDSEAGTVTEASGGSYARVAVSRNATQFPNARPIVNANDILFPEATADWGVCIGYGIWDAATNGNLLFYRAFTATRNVTTGVVLRIPAGQAGLSMN